MPEDDQGAAEAAEETAAADDTAPAAEAAADEPVAEATEPEEPAAEAAAEEPSRRRGVVEEPAAEPRTRPRRRPAPPRPRARPQRPRHLPPPSRSARRSASRARSARRARGRRASRPPTRKPIVRLEKPDHERGRRQERQGTVVSDAMEKTIVVRVDVVKAHPRYKKVVRRSVKFHAHDESSQAKVGDVVRIVETRPLSKTKRWRLAEVVEAAK